MRRRLEPLAILVTVGAALLAAVWLLGALGVGHQVDEGAVMGVRPAARDHLSAVPAALAVLQAVAAGFGARPGPLRWHTVPGEPGTTTEPRRSSATAR